MISIIQDMGTRRLRVEIRGAVVVLSEREGVVLRQLLQAAEQQPPAMTARQRALYQLYEGTDVGGTA